MSGRADSLELMGYNHDLHSTITKGAELPVFFDYHFFLISCQGSFIPVKYMESLQDSFPAGLH